MQKREWMVRDRQTGNQRIIFAESGDLAKKAYIHYFEPLASKSDLTVEPIAPICQNCGKHYHELTRSDFGSITGLLVCPACIQAEKRFGQLHGD